MDPFEGQTAPESTRGFFDSPESSTKKDQRRRSIEPTPRNTTYRASLQPVNEDRALSRADVLAETEAKLTRRLSEPNARRLSESNNNNNNSNNNNRRSVRLSISDSSRKPLFVSHLPFSSVLPHLKQMYSSVVFCVLIVVIVPMPMSSQKNLIQTSISAVHAIGTVLLKEIKWPSN
ncbi:unnamed protein product [Rhizopus stolonifer]